MVRALHLARVLALFLSAFASGAPGRSETPEEVEALVREAEDLASFEAFAPALARLEQALAVAEVLNDPSLTALCLDRMGLVLGYQGDGDGADERQARALALAREIGDSRREAEILASIGASRGKGGRPMFLRLAEELMAAYRREGEAMTKRENTIKMADANKAFAHFAW